MITKEQIAAIALESKGLDPNGNAVQLAVMEDGTTSLQPSRDYQLRWEIAPGEFISPLCWFSWPMTEEEVEEIIRSAEEQAAENIHFDEEQDTRKSASGWLTSNTRSSQ